ncbi:hypothetical protein [Natrinema ejinorense]|uniref:hypothetical protein n=1 Tax=Natrinema ejinorense TaxID=373386 RepID=UPI0014767818|nr:hypothetical protein [Natrinema ejinorense]
MPLCRESATVEYLNSGGARERARPLDDSPINDLVITYEWDKQVEPLGTFLDAPD